MNKAILGQRDRLAKAFEPAPLLQPRLIRLKRHEDHRGWFMESFRESAVGEIMAIEGARWVQDNHSFTERKGTIRGLHFQVEPCATAKLVRILSGSILDVMVDVRLSSPDFGKVHRVTLDAAAPYPEMLYVPAGFAHGFVTLTDNVNALYKMDGEYSAVHDRALNPFDPDLNIGWLYGRETCVISDKDAKAPTLKELFP